MVDHGIHGDFWLAAAPVDQLPVRLTSEAQALQLPENLGMAPAARLVVVDVEKASEPGMYKAREVRFWRGRRGPNASQGRGFGGWVGP